MAALHSSIDNGCLASVDLLGHFEQVGHVPLDALSGEVPAVDGVHVPLDTNGNHSHDMGSLPTLAYEQNLTSQQDWEEEWNRMLTELSAAPVLPSLECNDEPKGKAATIQKFYEGRPTCKCCTNWVERQPEKVPEEAQEKYDGVAIRLYHGKDHSKETLGGLKTVSPLWLGIQSPIILKTLEPIFKKIGRVGAAKGSMLVTSPFSDLFFAYSEILEAYSDCEKDSEEEQHLRVLKEITDELLRETTSKVADLQAKKLITYEYLWTLFPKGIIVVSKQKGQEKLYEVTSYNTATTTVNVRYVDFDGYNYGFKEDSFTEFGFGGARPIRELVVYPLSFHENREDLERNIIQRSRKVLLYQEMMHAEYSQIEVDEKTGQRSGPFPAVAERIIVDPYGCRKLNRVVSITRLTSDNTDFDEELRNHFELQGAKNRLSVERIQKNTEIVSSKPHWLLLLNPFIAGYSLKRHGFYTFYVDYIRSVEWNDWAFERLVFQEDSKDSLLTLVKNHGQMRGIGQDIIPGKGNGFVVLLSGPPGTGKTLTAEAVAEQAQRPFIRVQAEMLGRCGDDLEEELEQSFELATEWNALLLIDEADAYLGTDEERSDRSSLVRILMTRLEYYSGVLFLTTNFPEKIDEAFSSRIDVHFEYPMLDRISRCRLLKNMTEFIISSSAFTETANLTEQDYWRLARWKLNGRELKNAVKVASRLCSIKKEQLSYHGLETAIRHTAPRKFIESESSPPPAKRARLV